MHGALSSIERPSSTVAPGPQSFPTKQRSDHSLFSSSPDFESQIETVSGRLSTCTAEVLHSYSGMKKKKKTSAHRRRSTAAYNNTYQSRHVQSHHDDVAGAETDQFTHHGQLWCDSSELRLPLSLEPQLLNFDQRANVNVKKLSLAEDLLFLHWRSRRCNMCNRSTLHRTTSAPGSSANEGKKARWRQCVRPFSFYLFLCQSRQTNARAPDEKWRFFTEKSEEPWSLILK